LIVLPLFEAGLLGMRRRVADYDTAIAGLQPLQLLSAVGGSLVFLGLAVMVHNLVVSSRKGAVAGNNPWRAETLEWMVPSPPPEDNFVETPRVVGQPHQFGVPGAVHAIIGTASDRQEGTR